MNKLICLGVSILEMSKTVMYELWYIKLEIIIKPKYKDKSVSHGYR